MIVNDGSKANKNRLGVIKIKRVWSSKLNNLKTNSTQVM
jgi:hypothetical protein